MQPHQQTVQCELEHSFSVMANKLHSLHKYTHYGREHQKFMCVYARCGPEELNRLKHCHFFLFEFFLFACLYVLYITVEWSRTRPSQSSTKFKSELPGLQDF